ncbi:MAG TPA: YncE family protein [Prolixibacteraceae bacterium]|nr:YncE family protein [Prolixibacteraceae bacterium]
MIFRKRYGLRLNLMLLLVMSLLSGCMKDDEWVQDHLQQGNIQLPEGGLFVINEGNFMYGNATLSYYDTLKKEVQNDLFYKVNGLPLGDVAESMAIWKSNGYIVVNNSGKIYVMDIHNGKYTAKITGLTSPRFIHFVDDQKAYVTDLYAGKITIVNPATNMVTGSIPCPSHPSTEEMVQFGNLVFVSCWSGDKTVLVIDSDKDQIIHEITTGEQPCGVVLDKHHKIWVLCQSTPGNNAPVAKLQRIDPVTLSLEKSYSFAAGVKPVKLTVDGKGENLFFLQGNGVFKMPVSDGRLPETAFIELQSKLLYSLGADPVNGNIYVGDALDYQQSGIISRFSESGALIGTFKAGIIPGRFCFK